MSGITSVASASAWQRMLSDTPVVVADFYADWCGPCKQIAPMFEKLAKEHATPKKLAFVKIDTDRVADVARSCGVTAMPTFQIFHNGSCIETIKGANPSALNAAVAKAVKLAGSPSSGAPGASFKTQGRTLGGDKGPPGMLTYDLTKFYKRVIAFIGLYLVSLFTLDAYKSAEGSSFNVNRRPTSMNQRSSSQSINRSGHRAPPVRTIADCS